jgi:radical SAM protein with 4Fe4S-binding SPASM domain
MVAALSTSTAFALRPTPLEVYIEPTNRCNEFCTTCPRTFFQREPPADLDLAKFVKILDQFPGVRRVVLHGVGEPLLARDLPRMVAEANRRGAQVLFNTNALALSPRLMQQLVDAGLDQLRVSMDAADPRTYRRIRGVDGYAKAMANTARFCAYLRERGTTRPEVWLYFICMRENLPELPAVIERAAAMGVAAVNLQRLVYFGVGEAVEAQSVFGERAGADIERLIDECIDVAARSGIRLEGSGRRGAEHALDRVDSRRPWSGCSRPWRSTYVTANGNVLPCCIAPFSTHDYGGVILGNLFETPIGDIWSGEPYHDFRAAHRSDSPPEPCRGCGTRWMY